MCSRGQLSRRDKFKYLKIKQAGHGTGKQSPFTSSPYRIYLRQRDKSSSEWPVVCKRLLLGMRLKFQGFPAFKYHHLVFLCEMHTIQWLGRVCACQEGRAWCGTFGHFWEIMSQNVWQLPPPRIPPRPRGVSSWSGSKCTNMHPIKCVCGALVPGAAAPILQEN